MSEVGIIYKLYNTQSKKFYIGVTTRKNYRRRINVHFNYLRNNKHPNDLIQNDFNLHKEEDFKVELLEEFLYNTKEEKFSREIFWVEKTNSYYKDNPLGFNKTRGGLNLYECHGELNVTHKYSEKFVKKMLKEIDKNYRSKNPKEIQQLAKEYGVTTAWINKLRNNKTWKHLDREGLQLNNIIEDRIKIVSENMKKDLSRGIYNTNRYYAEKFDVNEKVIIAFLSGKVYFKQTNNSYIELQKLKSKVRFQNELDYQEKIIEFFKEILKEDNIKALPRRELMNKYNLSMKQYENIINGNRIKTQYGLHLQNLYLSKKLENNTTITNH